MTVERRWETNSWFNMKRTALASVWSSSARVKEASLSFVNEPCSISLLLLQSSNQNPPRNTKKREQKDLCSSNPSIAKMAAPSPIPAGISKEQAFSMAQTEMEYRVELFNKCTMYNFDISFDRSLLNAVDVWLAQTCFVKCVDKRYKEAELNMGENSCIDRCVSKYWQVNGMVGQLLSAGKPPHFFGNNRRGGNSFFDPFSLDVWDPFKDFPSSSSFSRENSAIVNARVDWRETPEAHVFKADLPGMKKEEVKVEIEDDNVLKISGERHVEKEDKSDTWHRVERSSGQFTRKFRLPENVKMDQVKAALENGVLTVTVPKVEAEKASVRSVQISG
ncbi:hypothetical protein HID58_018084 [Brassica napus]|uniref:SHSP domain-containing protein n=1 Tax=Brassica napus TaxID=3708 RepID=A0ABQ8D8Y7_BRANA|nr:hypothetical protein HID58_018084 [Brassica napus]